LWDLIVSPLGEFLSFASPKERNQRKGDATPQAANAERQKQRQNLFLGTDADEIPRRYARSE
jgi:hypothetical protein